MRSAYRQRGQQGFALLITLAVLALIVTVVVVFATLTRFESKSARSQFEVERARLYAGMAVTDVIAKLRDNIPVATTAGYLPSQTGTAVAGPNCAWAAAPGRLVVPDATQTPPFRTIPLYSGTATAANSVDLNQPLIGESSQYPIIPVNSSEYTSAVPMTVAWIYVCRDGTKSSDTGYAPSAANPITGRYAYWTDTETSKVNLNTAGNAQLNYQGTAAAYNPNAAVSTGDNSYSYTYGSGDIQNLSGHPSRIDLSQLDSGITLAQSLATYRFTDSSFWTDFPNSGSTSTHGLDSPTASPAARAAGDGMGRFNQIEDWVNTPGMPTAVTSSQVEANKFYLTTRAWAPELTPWGTNKLWLQENDPQNAVNYGANFPANRLNAPGAPVFPPNATLPPIGWGMTPLAGDPPNVDFRYYVYPPVGDVSNPSPTNDLLLFSGSNPSAANFQFVGPATLFSGLGDLSSFLNNLMFQFKRRDWPGMPAQSFVDKYGQQECEDLAFDMASLTDSAIAGGSFNPYRMVKDGNAVPSWASVPDRVGAYGNSIFRYHDPTVAGETDRCFMSSALGPLIKQVQVQFLVTSNNDTSQFSTGGFTSVNAVATQTTDSTTGTSLLTKDQAAPGFAPPVSNPNNYFNVAMAPVIQYYYPRSLAHSAPFAYGSPTGSNSAVGISDIEVSASGTYNKAPISYSSPIGAVNNHFVWSYLDDSGHNFGGYATGVAFGAKTLFSPSSYAANGDYANSNYLGQVAWGLNNGAIFIGPFDIGSTVTATIKFRAFISHMDLTTNFSLLEMAPLPPASLGSTYPTGYTGGTYPYVPDALASHSTKLVFTKTLKTDPFGNISPVSAAPAYVTLETSDPRDFRYASDWVNSGTNNSTLAQKNNNFYGKGKTSFTADSLTGIVGDDSKLIWPDVSAQSNPLNWNITPFVNDPRWQQNAGNITGFPGIGWISALPTNCESSVTWSGNNVTLGLNGNLHPWRTISLEPSVNTNNLPDWLMLELYALAYDSTYLSQTQGKININADIQPFAGVTRQKPLQALLTPSYDYSGTSASAISSALASYTDISAGKFNLPKNIFLYPSEICEVASMGGSGANQAQREALARDTIGLMTTQCSDFMVHAIAQSLAPNTSDPTQPGIILSEQRLRAVVSRTVNVGPDGIPGTSDDPQAYYQNGNTFGLETLKFDGTDLPLLGYSGAPLFQYKITNFNFLTR